MLALTSITSKFTRHALLLSAGFAIISGGLLGTGTSVAFAADPNCTPNSVVVFSNRVHIRCEEIVGGIQYFAASTADAAHIARVLSIISTATVAGRVVSVRYDPADTSGTAIGCQANDCRLIQAVGFYR